MNVVLEDNNLFIAGIDLVEAGVACVVNVTTTKGVETILNSACSRIFQDDIIDNKRSKAVKRTIKIASKVIGGRLAGEYAKDISSILKGAYYGYRTGCALAKRPDISGSEFEVLDGGSEEE